MNTNKLFSTNIFDLQKKSLYIPTNNLIYVRKNKLRKLNDTILEMEPEITEALFKDFRKPISETRLTEIFPVTSEIKFILKNLSNWTKIKRVKTPLTFIGAKSKIEFQPKGRVLIISPWNYPFLLAVRPLTAAIASGNSVILKPSEYSPNTSNIIKKIVEVVFKPEEAFVAIGDQTVAEYLLELPFDHIFFTGSTSVGKLIMKKAASNLSSITLELGGKSPAVVDKNSDINIAARRLVWGKFINAGQTCVAPDYILVHKNSSKEFQTRLKHYITVKYGDIHSLNRSSDLARIINEKHFTRLLGLLTNSESFGDNVIFGGIHDNRDCYFSPTIVRVSSLESPLMKEEIFGPILPILEYEHESEVIEIINTISPPLSIYVFSNDKSFRNMLSQNTQSGSIVFNDCVVQFPNHHLPFGGVKESGIGRSHGIHGFHEFSNKRAVMISPKLSLTRIFYPPYTLGLQKLINLLIKYF